MLAYNKSRLDDSVLESLSELLKRNVGDVSHRNDISNDHDDSPNLLDKSAAAAELSKSSLQILERQNYSNNHIRKQSALLDRSDLTFN